MGYRVVAVKRRLTKLVLFLLLGAVVNVGVAWVYSMGQTSNVASDSVGSMQVDGEYWVFFSANHNLIADRIDWSSYTQSDSLDLIIVVEDEPPGVSRIDSVLLAVQGVSGHASITNGYEQHIGWPMRALWCCFFWGDYHMGSGPVFADGLQFRQRNATAGTTWSYPVILPVHVLWPGLLINTIFYGALLWLLTLGPFTARRFIRRKRGHCIKCGYDLRGHSGGGGDVCPECGATTT